MNVLLNKNFIAETAIGANLIVKYGSADDKMVQAAAVADKLMGVSEGIAAAIGERCDVTLHGIGDVICGGVVARGDPLTTDANGKAVVAAPGAGTNNRIVGFAMASGVLNDIIPVDISPGFMQG